VTDACDGTPLGADIHIDGVEAARGEMLQSGGRFGRFAAILPPGEHSLVFRADGYTPQWHIVEVPVHTADAEGALLEVALAPESPDPCDDLDAPDTPDAETADLPEWGCGCSSGISPQGLGPVLLLLLGLRPRRRS
jgi:uncharacterized protein (TIGR03382 family)